MSRGFESHRLRQRQHLAGRCFLFLQQAMQGLQGGIRTARARRFASRRAATVLRTVARARENPTVCANYHYSSSTLGSDFLLPLSPLLRFCHRPDYQRATPFYARSKSDSSYSSHFIKYRFSRFGTNNTSKLP